MDQQTAPIHGSLVDGVFIVEGVIESIDGQSFPEGSAKIGIKYREGGYSIVVVPLEFACVLSLGAAVSLTVVAR